MQTITVIAEELGIKNTIVGMNCSDDDPNVMPPSPETGYYVTYQEH